MISSMVHTLHPYKMDYQLYFMSNPHIVLNFPVTSFFKLCMIQYQVCILLTFFDAMQTHWFYHANYLHHFIDNASPLRDIHSLILEASNACCAHMQTMLQQSNCVHTILRQCKSYKMHNQMHAY